MSARSEIPKAFVNKLKEALNGTGDYVNNLYGNVTNKVTHFQDIVNYPTVTVTPGPESRDDMPSNFTMCTLEVYIRIYVQNPNDAQGELETIISDLEKFVDNNLNIEYNLITSQGSEAKRTISNSIVSISTDEGLLDPNAIGEIILSVQYEKIR